MASFVFDKGQSHSRDIQSSNMTSLYTDKELMRKRYVASLESRTAEQIVEEEALYIEVKRFEQNERRFKKERDDLLRSLMGVDSGLPDIPVDEEGPGVGALFSDAKSKKNRRGYGMDIDSPMTPSNVIALGPPVPKRLPSAKTLAQGLLFVY
jgi:DNA methyltransferase 1-associated protein 1